jgi:hypothetical protein
MNMAETLDQALHLHSTNLSAALQNKFSHATLLEFFAWYFITYKLHLYMCRSYTNYSTGAGKYILLCS